MSAIMADVFQKKKKMGKGKRKIVASKKKKKKNNEHDNRGGRVLHETRVLIIALSSGSYVCSEELSRGSEGKGM